jgi:hypothetical protein
MDWWTEHKDAISTIGAAVGTLLAIGGVIWAVIRRAWQKKLRVESKVFEVLSDPAVLLPKLFATEDDNSPLADHRIPYQPRHPGRDIQAQLKAELNRSRYLLITAPTGYGKTREAGMLAQTLMLEGWRVVRVKSGWLDLPKDLSAELGGRRSRLLILLDDLNGLFGFGEKGSESPRAEKMPLLAEASYHDRLLRTLNLLEEICTPEEIRVLAAARSEAEQWKLLNYDPRDPLWKRFARFELPERAERAAVDLLKDCVGQAEMEAYPAEFDEIARRDEGSYRNILLNLRRWKIQGKAVRADDFIESQWGSWREVYERVCARQPAAAYLYDAMEVLRQARIELFPFLVEETALLVWSGNWLQRLHRRRAIRRALRFLREENIIRHANGRLAPADGQIEARGRAVPWAPFARPLAQLLLARAAPPSRTRFSIWLLPAMNRRNSNFPAHY